MTKTYMEPEFKAILSASEDVLTSSLDAGLDVASEKYDTAKSGVGEMVGFNL